jgi:hypothetical protein
MIRGEGDLRIKPLGRRNKLPHFSAFSPDFGSLSQCAVRAENEEIRFELEGLFLCLRRSLRPWPRRTGENRIDDKIDDSALFHWIWQSDSNQICCAAEEGESARLRVSMR